MRRSSRSAGDLAQISGRSPETKAPRSALRAFACAPSGAARVDRSTTGRMSGVSLRLDLFTSPVSPCGVAGDAAFRTRHRFPGLEPEAPLHADPVARALGPGARQSRPRWVQLGWPQFLRLLYHDAVATPRPRAECSCRPKAPGRLPPEGDELARSSRRTARRRRVAPKSSNVPAGLRLPRHPKVQRARSDPTPAPVSRDGRRLVVAPVLPRESGSPVRGGREHCPCSDPLRLVSGVGWAEAPSSPPRSACALRNEHQ